MYDLILLFPDHCFSFYFDTLKFNHKSFVCTRSDSLAVCSETVLPFLRSFQQALFSVLSSLC